MAWGIIMTALTMLGMLGLVIFEITSEEGPRARADSRGGAAAVALRPAA